jgi:tetratricopeptide (TPR) repeat protein
MAQRIQAGIESLRDPMVFEYTLADSDDDIDTATVTLTTQPGEQHPADQVAEDKLAGDVEVRDLGLLMARRVNPDCVAVGISINTHGMPEAEALRYLAEREVGEVFNLFALVYSLQGNYAQAQIFYFQALTKAEESGDEFGKTIALSNIGELYERQNNLSKANELYQNKWYRLCSIAR